MPSQKPKPSVGDAGSGKNVGKLAASHVLPPIATPLQAAIRAELYGSDICSALGIAIRAYAPAIELCRQLVAGGRNPNTPLHAYRLGVLCLTIRSIGEAAGLEINGDGTGFRRRRAPDAGLPMAQIRRGAL